MAGTASEIVVGASGTVYVAATGTTAPVDSDSAVHANFLAGELGFVSEDGITITDSKDMAEIASWQSFYSTRRIVTGRAFQVSFTLEQWNEINVKLAFGGGTVTGLGGGEYSYVPPAPELVDERALVVDWTDGTKDYRLYIPKGIVTESVETNIVRSAAAVLPITFAAIADGVADPYTLFTNDPAFA